MLSIKPIASGAHATAYYAGLDEDHDYYSEDGTRPGLFYGQGSRALGLSGEVQPDVLRNLLEGLSPDGTKNLVQKRSGKKLVRRAGFDLTFSLPKSLSIAWATADGTTRSEIDRRARAAVERTLDVVQELCGVARRGKDGLVQEDAKLTFAIFSHDTARGLPGEAPDVARHFHCVLPNVVVREDGTTCALDARPLFTRRMKMALGALFRAELSKELEAMGLKTHRPNRQNDKLASWIELDCVPDALCTALSKRRGEIEKWLKKHGLSGAKAAELAALTTRGEKTRFTQAELFRKWRETSEAFGFTWKELAAELNSVGTSKRDPQHEAAEACQRALKAISKTKARFTETELLEATAVEAQCRGVGIREIRAQLAQTLSNDSELVRLQDDGSTRTFTTKEMLSLEKSMLAIARRLTGHVRELPAPIVEEAIRQAGSLREEQAEAVRAICSPSSLACIQGVAGSGKTFMLKTARLALEACGYQVLGTSLAAKASRGLEKDSGIQSHHIHRLLTLIDRGELKLDANTVLVIDEAGMVGTRHFQKLLKLIEQAGGRMVACGDWNQLQAVDAGAAFRGVAEDVGYCSMKEIIRQKEAWAREMVLRFRSGEAQSALEELALRGKLFIGEDREDAVERVVLDWAELLNRGERLKETLVLAGTNQEVRELNRRLQAERVDQLGDTALEIDGYDIRVGDRVMTTRNNPLLCVDNGSFGEVTAVSGEALTVRLDDSGFQIEIDTTTFSDITLAYAVTTHKAQGMTVDNALVLCGDTMSDREMSYVQASRARSDTRVYSDALSAQGIPELAAIMARSRQKELAYEHVLEAV